MSNEPVEIGSVIDRIGDISTLPHTAKRIMDVVSDPDSDASNLQEVILHDPALTAKVLRLVNSAYYGFSGQIADLQRAVIVLGFNAIRNLAISISVCDLFKSKVAIGDYTRVSVWNHSVAVAICAKMISLRAGTRWGEEAFIGGILHDIGIILEDQYLHEQFVPIIEEVAREKLPLSDVERQVLGMDHTQVGRRVLAKWRLPERLCQCAAYHSQPQLAHEEIHSLVAAINVADFLCKAKKIGFNGDPTIEPAKSFALQTLNFGKTDLLVLFEDMDEEIAQARDFFTLVEGLG